MKFQKKKDVRDAIFDRGCDFICELVTVLPKDFKEKIVMQLQKFNDEIVEIGNDIAAHKYELKSFVDDEVGKIYYLERDCLSTDYRNEHNHWWLRRIFIDQIPYDEIKSRSTELLTRVQNVDNSKNADVLSIYKLAKGFLLCIGCNEYGADRYLYSCATKQKHYGVWENLRVRIVIYSPGMYISPITGGCDIQKIIENGKTIFKASGSRYVEDEYRKMGFDSKQEILKLDEDGNFLDINVEYKK